MQKVIQEAKASLMQEEARKATRRAADHGKAHGRLVWQLVRRAQKRPECLLSIVPRDALRLIVERFIADETVRLEELYLGALPKPAKDVVRHLQQMAPRLHTPGSMLRALLAATHRRSA